MRADRVKVNLGMTIQGAVQYEMIRVDVGLEKDVPEGADSTEWLGHVKGEVEEFLKKTIAGYRAEMNPVKKVKK